MAAEMSIEVFGVRDALRELGQIDKQLRFKAIAKIKSASGEMQAIARENYPSDADLRDKVSGWSPGGRVGYSKAKADRGLQVQVGGRSRGDSYAIVTLIQKDPGAAMYDIAGLRNGASGKPGGPDRLGRARGDGQSEAFLDALNSGFGPAQRGMWRQVRKIREVAAGRLMDALSDVAAQVNRKLVA